MNSNSRALASIVSILLLVAASSEVNSAYANTLLCRSKNGTISLRSSCKKGETRLKNYSQLAGATGPTGVTGATGAIGAAGATGATGPTGAAGTQGTDGALRVWGDGSKGSATLSGSFSESNPQYTDFTVAESTSLSVNSGTTIRATGTCTINGTIIIAASSAGGVIRTFTASTLMPSITPSITGQAYSSSGPGEFGTSADVLFGATGGSGLLVQESSKLLSATLHAGGAGGPGYGGSGGTGGGSIALFCKNGIVIGANGLIQANGGSSLSAGGGGGAGGLVVLASTVSIVNSGTISAAGASGGASMADIGAGGGGGGGVVNLVAPAVAAGTISLTAGAAGSGATTVTSNPRMAGSCGGSFGGGGGSGGNVSVGGATSAGPGTVGKTATILADPTSLIL